MYLMYALTAPGFIALSRSLFILEVARESEVVDLRELMGVNDLLPPIGNVE